MADEGLMIDSRVPVSNGFHKENIMSRASRVVSAAVLSLAVATPISAQSSADGYKLPYEIVKGYLTKSAEQVTDANYSFKPTPEVRTMGQLFGHIANANFMICSMASGLENPS